MFITMIFVGFPDSSVSKASAYSAGDPGSIPGLGSSTGEGTGYPLQYFWASLVAQLVKNPPAMWETCVWSLGWEDPLEKGKTTHSSILAWRIPWTVLSMGSQRVGHNWTTFSLSLSMICLLFWPILSKVPQENGCIGVEEGRNSGCGAGSWGRAGRLCIFYLFLSLVWSRRYS